MAKSKRVSMSKAKLAETGETLEIAGTMAEIEGAEEMVDGAADLQVAKEAVAIGVAEVASGASDLTRAADAAVVAERVQVLSDIVGEAGIVDVGEGVDMLMKGGNVRAMGAIVSLMSREELERGLQLGRLAGELGTVSDVIEILDMPVLADFLGERGMLLQEIAVDQLLRYTGTRALAGAIKETGQEIEAWASRKSPKAQCAWPYPRQPPSAARSFPWRAMPWQPGAWISSRQRKWREMWRAKPQQVAWLKSRKGLRPWAPARLSKRWVKRWKIAPDDNYRRTAGAAAAIQRCRSKPGCLSVPNRTKKRLRCQCD